MKTKFYVMHYKQAPERKNILHPKLEELGIEAEWYTDYDQEDLTEELIDELYSEDLELFKHRMDGWKTDEDYRNYKGITRSHLSLVIKFIKCIETIAESDYDNVVFFEDHPSTNTTSSFAMTKEACVKILDTLYPVCNSVDWEFNYHFAANNFRVFHPFPYICGQASTSGRCESTLTLK